METSSSIYLALTFAAFVGCAGCTLAWKARRLLAWPLAYRWALLGQLGVSVVALAAAMLFIGAASAGGLARTEFLLIFGLVGFLLAWSMGLGTAIDWHAARARDHILIPYRLRALKWNTFFAVFQTTAVAGALVYGGAELNLISRLQGALPSAAVDAMPGKPLLLRLERDTASIAAKLRDSSRHNERHDRQADLDRQRLP